MKQSTPKLTSVFLNEGPDGSNVIPISRGKQIKKQNDMSQTDEQFVDVADQIHSFLDGGSVLDSLFLPPNSAWKRCEQALDNFVTEYDKVKKNGKNESNMVRPTMSTEKEDLDEIEHEFFDYPSDQMHPQLQQNREKLRQGIQWVVKNLNDSDSYPAQELAKQFAKIPDLPSDQVLPTLKRAQEALWKFKGQMKKNQLPGELPDEIKNAQRAIDQATQGIPSLMKLAGSLQSSTVSDKGLYRKGVKGRWDDESGFIPKSTYEVPTGMEIPGSKPRVIPTAAQTFSKTHPVSGTKRAASPEIRRAADKQPEKKPVVPTPRKKESAWEQATSVLESWDLFSRGE